MSSQKKPTAEELGFIADDDGVIRIDDLVIPAAPVAALSNAVPDSRLVITHLSVKNFKSYAAEQTIGPFDKNFTAIVGPNGSGKSNVIDALMFVFGHKAKNIRAKKISNLIHKSDRHPDVASCTVSVHFAIIEKDGSIVADSKFIVSRTVNADSSSYYEICNKRVQQKEVIRLLRKYGIDMEYNRFLILQGEIESISLMSPKGQNEHETGMLEYIEDIIGSNRLIEPLKYFSEKIVKLQVEQKEKLTLLKMVEKEKEELEAPKNKAIEYLRLENKCILSENSVFHYQRMEAEKELETLQENKKKFVEEMKALKAEKEKLQSAKKALENELQEVNIKHDSVFKKCEDNKEEFKALEREDAANLMNIRHAKGKTASLKGNLEQCQNEITKLQKQAATYESETAELQIKKKRLEEEKDIDEKKATEVMHSLKQETVTLQEKKDKYESELIKLKENCNDLKSEKDLKQRELDIYVSGEKKEKERLASLISNHEKNATSSKREDDLLNKEAIEIQEIEKELLSLQPQLRDAKESELSLTQQLKNERMKYEEARNTQQTSKNSSTLLQALLKEKAKGRMPGIYGRLGDLGAIDEKYDIAISTACGRLENIVTDDLNTAQMCVDFLKKNNLGYATFVALDQMKRYESYVHQKVATPENIPRLFDLIRVKDTDILPAFYFALGETLVSPDLNQATRVGLQGKTRHRVVTLKGEVVDPSGTMSGGGSRPLKGRMGQTVVQCLFTEEDLNRMLDTVNSINRRLSEVKKLYSNLEDAVTQKSRKVESLRHSLKKRRMHCNAYKEQVEILAVQITEQEKKVSESSVDKKTVQLLQEEIKVKDKAYKKAAQETSVVDETVAKIQDEILKISKGKFSKAKKTVEQLKKKLDDVTDALTRSNVNLKQSKTKIKKLENKIKSVQSDLEANDKVLQGLKGKQEALTAKGTEAQELMSKYLDEIKVFKEKQGTVKTEIEAFNKKEHEMKQVEIEHSHELKKYDASESEKKGFIRHINAKVGKLKLNEVEDDPLEIPSLTNDEISNLNYQSLRSDLDIMKVQLEGMKPDLSAINEYQKKVQMYEEKQKDYNSISKQKNLQTMRYDELNRKRLKEFMAGFTIIAKKLKQTYQMLALGGDAEVEMVDTLNPFAKGIEFNVRPPKKSWKYMRNLSGGEKTLSSLALVFALHYYRPTPFYVMDEIDAALDVRNVAIVGLFLLGEQKNAQFIIVSLRNIMNELPDELLGIYKVANCTKNMPLLSVLTWAKEDDLIAAMLRDYILEEN